MGVFTGFCLQLVAEPTEDGSGLEQMRWTRTRVEVQIPSVPNPDVAYTAVANQLQLTHEYPSGWLRVVAVLPGSVPDSALVDPDMSNPYADVDASVYWGLAERLPRGPMGTFTVFADCGGTPRCLTVSAANWVQAEAIVLEQLTREGFGPYDATPSLIAASVSGRVLPMGERRFTSPTGEPWTHSLRTDDLVA